MSPSIVECEHCGVRASAGGIIVHAYDCPTNPVGTLSSSGEGPAGHNAAPQAEVVVIGQPAIFHLERQEPGGERRLWDFALDGLDDGEQDDLRMVISAFVTAVGAGIAWRQHEGGRFRFVTFGLNQARTDFLADGIIGYVEACDGELGGLLGHLTDLDADEPEEDGAP